MKYITFEQFIKGNEVTIKSILAWWKPEMGDLVVSVKTNKPQCIAYTDAKKVYFLGGGCSTTWEYVTNVVPLLTTQQLIDFIEYKLDDRIDICRSDMNGHTIFTQWIDGVGECLFDFATTTDYLHLALWECAQVVCSRA